MATTLTALAGRLGVRESELKALKGLTEDQVAELDGVVAAALEMRAEQIDTGLAEALRAIPRPLRGRAAALMGVGRG